MINASKLQMFNADSYCFLEFARIELNYINQAPSPCPVSGLRYPVANRQGQDARALRERARRRPAKIHVNNCHKCESTNINCFQHSGGTSQLANLAPSTCPASGSHTPATNCARAMPERVRRLRGLRPQVPNRQSKLRPRWRASAAQGSALQWKRSPGKAKASLGVHNCHECEGTSLNSFHPPPAPSPSPVSISQ